MRKKDKQTIEMLREEFSKQSDGINVPLKLQKQSVVKMLRDSEGKEIKDFSGETGANKNSNIIGLRKLTAIAAMLAVIVGCALFMRYESGVMVIPSDYSGRSGVLVKSAESYEEIERTVEKILGKEEKPSGKPENEADKNNVSTTQQNIIDRFFGGKPAAEDSYKSEKTDVENVVVEKVEAISKIEADIVRTDGTYIYVAAKGVNAETGTSVEQIKIVKAVPANEMSIAATINLSDTGSASEVDDCFEIYLEGNKLIALMNRYSYTLSDSNAYDKLSAVAVYYDITDPTSPVKIREHVQDGKYVSSGITGENLCLVTAKSLSAASAEAEAIPSYSVNGEVNVPKAGNIFIAVNDPEASYLFVTSTNISDFTDDVDCLAVLGSGKTVSCSSDAIVFTRGFVSVDADEEGNRKTLTEIYRFDFGEDSIGFAGSYVVDGSVIGNIYFNPVSGGTVIASKSVASTGVYVLNEKMELVGKLEGLHQGENISGIKFIGTNCYIYPEGIESATVVDFSDPAKPRKTGAFENMSFAETVYSLSDTMLICLEAVSPQDSAQGVIELSLLEADASALPKVLSEYELTGKLVLPNKNDTKSIMVGTEKNLLGIPTVKINPSTGAKMSSYVLLSVSEGTISPVGIYNHDAGSAFGDTAVRATDIGDMLYTVSGNKITAFSISEGSVAGTQIIK